MSSSIRSAAPAWMSSRVGGVVTTQASSPSGSTSNWSAVSTRTTSALGMSKPSNRRMSAAARSITCGGSGARVSVGDAGKHFATGVIVEELRGRALRRPLALAPGEPLRLNRVLASLNRLNCRAVLRTLTKSKQALSSRMVFVPALTSVSRPPMTPASAIGPTASAMTRLSGASSRSWPSSVFGVSRPAPSRGER